jgi:hypothetical protein
MTTLTGGAWTGVKRWNGGVMVRRGVDPTTPFNTGQRVTARNNNTQTSITLPPLVDTGTGTKDILFVFFANPQYGNPSGTVTAIPGIGLAGLAHNQYLNGGVSQGAHVAPGTFTPSATTFSFATPAPSPVPNRSLLGIGLALNDAAAGPTIHGSQTWLINSVAPATIGTTRVIVQTGTTSSSGPTAGPTLSAAPVILPAPSAPLVIGGGGAVVVGEPQIAAFAQVIGTPTVVAPALEATEWIYERLPQAMQDADRQLERDLGYPPLKGYLSTLGDSVSEVNVVFDRLNDQAALVDPALADPGWLPWLAQLYGVELDASDTVDEQRAKIAAWDDTPVGSRAAVVAAAQAFMTGTKLVLVEPQYNGNPWRVALHTRSTETTDAAALTAAAQAVAPAGVEIVQQTGIATWADTETLYPTWADVNGKTFTEIQDTRAP